MKDRLTRRQALKTVIASGGGIMAASFLPEKWLKPIVQSGVLPAHAQASSCSQVIRTLTFGTVAFDNANEHDYELFNGEPMGELLACNTRLSFAWTGDDSPNQLVALNLYYSGGTTTFKAIQPNTSSPATFTDQALWNNGVVYQGVNIYDGSSSSSIPFESYSWNVGTMTLTIS